VSSAGAPLRLIRTTDSPGPHVPHVAVRRDGDRTPGACRGVVELAQVAPAGALVELPGPGILGDDGQPGLRMTAIGDERLGSRQERPRHDAPTVPGRDIEL